LSQFLKTISYKAIGIFSFFGKGVLQRGTRRRATVFTANVMLGHEGGLAVASFWPQIFTDNTDMN
jgi:hypothetical protein